MLIGYARVSTEDQNLNLQIDALKKAGCEKIFDDHITGSKKDRPGLDKALDCLRPNDILVVWRLDRLSRSLKDLIEIVSRLSNEKIGFQSIHESIDTTTSTGNLVFHIFGALAEFERTLIRERTMAGLAAARARGKLGGRPKKLNSVMMEGMQKMYDSREHSILEICNIFGISKVTFYRYVVTDKEKIIVKASDHNAPQSL